MTDTAKPIPPGYPWQGGDGFTTVHVYMPTDVDEDGTPLAEWSIGLGDYCPAEPDLELRFATDVGDGTPVHWVAAALEEHMMRGWSGRKQEVMFSIRRTDGEGIGCEEYTFLTTSGPDDWSGVDVEPGDLYDDDEPVEYEIVRMDVTSVAKKLVGGAGESCPVWDGTLTPASTRWHIMVPPSGDENTWPAGRRGVLFTVADTEAEAAATIAALPEVFYYHHFSSTCSAVDRSVLVVERFDAPERASRCRTCRWERHQHPGMARCIRCGVDVTVDELAAHVHTDAGEQS